MDICLCFKGERGVPGLPGPSTVLPVEKLERGLKGDPGGGGLPGFLGPRGTKSGQTIQLDLISLDSNEISISGIKVFVDL